MLVNEFEIASYPCFTDSTVLSGNFGCPLIPCAIPVAVSASSAHSLGR